MRARSLMLSWLLLLGLVLAPAVWADAALWGEVQSLRHDGAYADASAWRRAQVRALVADLVRSLPSGQLPAGAARRAAEAGLHLEEAEGWIVLSSLPEQADGFFVLRKGAGLPPLVLEAPHAWFDLKTGPLACALFEQGFGRALLVNTAQRKSASQGDLSADAGALGADVAHRPESIYQAATLGVADALNDPLVVQLHGFGDDHGAWAAVLSEGAAIQPASDLAMGVAALGPLLTRWGGVATGAEVPELAARTNAQSKALSGHARFLHVELSLAARNGLLSDPALLAELGRALQRTAERRP
ncbi:MAG: hypothetical protein ABIO70_19660 [Pseudomonadota bacterium]